MFRLLIIVVFVSLFLILVYLINKLVKNRKQVDNVDVDVDTLEKDLQSKIDFYEIKYREGVIDSEKMLDLYKKELEKVKNLKQKLNS
jgi:heme/copper-type cytochrome/quinol oxidase subunit 1